MRTTLTLDDDVAKLLERAMRCSGKGFKEAVNHYLRQGLMHTGRPARKRFVVVPRDLGLPPGLSYDNIEDLVSEIEGEDHR